MEGVRRGEPVAFDRLVRRYVQRAFSLSFRVLRNREDAQDQVQQAFLTVLRKIDRFDSRRPFAPWFHRLVMNQALNARKARRLRTTEPESAEPESPVDPPDARVMDRETREQLKEAMDRLPERQRLIVRLAEIDGLSGAEIGRMLGIAEGTVRWHLHEARAALRKALRRHGGIEG